MEAGARAGEKGGLEGEQGEDGDEQAWGETEEEADAGEAAGAAVVFGNAEERRRDFGFGVGFEVEAAPAVVAAGGEFLGLEFGFKRGQPVVAVGAGVAPEFEFADGKGPFLRWRWRERMFDLSGGTAGTGAEADHAPDAGSFADEGLDEAEGEQERFLQPAEVERWGRQAVEADGGGDQGEQGDGGGDFELAEAAGDDGESGPEQSGSPLDEVASGLTVDALEGGVAEGAEVNSAFSGIVDGKGVAVDATAPACAAQGTKACGVLFHEQGFGVAVTALLAQVGADGEATVMPDHGAGDELEGAAGFAEAPADVDVIASGGEDGSEAADGFEGGFADGEIAAGEVLGFGVVEEDVGG